MGAFDTASKRIKDFFGTITAAGRAAATASLPVTLDTGVAKQDTGVMAPGGATEYVIINGAIYTQVVGTGRIASGHVGAVGMTPTRGLWTAITQEGWWGTSGGIFYVGDVQYSDLISSGYITVAASQFLGAGWLAASPKYFRFYMGVDGWDSLTLRVYNNTGQTMQLDLYGWMTGYNNPTDYFQIYSKSGILDGAYWTVSPIQAASGADATIDWCPQLADNFAYIIAKLTLSVNSAGGSFSLMAGRK